MRVAYYAESPADEAALKILTEAILGKPTESVIHAGLRHRGWPAVKNALPAVLKQLHYRTDAEGFIFVVDSNGTPPHASSHEPPNTPELSCRLCQIRAIAAAALQEVRPRTSLPPLKIAFGLAIPTIEAWLLCGTTADVNEAAWINGLKNKQPPYNRLTLKERLYGTSRPSLDLETEKMKMSATFLSANLGLMAQMFPQGFGALMGTLRSW